MMNALKIVEKELHAIRIAMIGMGAANVATYRLLKACGADLTSIVACDSKGIVHKDRRDIEERLAEFGDKWRICQETNGGNIRGGLRRRCNRLMSALRSQERMLGNKLGATDGQERRGLRVC